MYNSTSLQDKYIIRHNWTPLSIITVHIIINSHTNKVMQWFNDKSFLLYIERTLVQTLLLIFDDQLHLIVELCCCIKCWPCYFKVQSLSFFSSLNCTMDYMADFDWATRVTRVTRVPIEHPRSLIHVTILDLDKKGESSSPLPEAIAVWTGFTWVTMSLAVTVSRQCRPQLHKQLMKYYTRHNRLYIHLL